MVSDAVLPPVLRSPEGSSLKLLGMSLVGSSVALSWVPFNALADGDALAGGDDAEVAVAVDEVLEQPAMRAPRMTATGTPPAPGTAFGREGALQRARVLAAFDEFTRAGKSALQEG